VPYLRERAFADGVRRRAAEYVIAIPPDEWLPQDVWFKDVYRPVHEIRVNGFYSNRPLVIYERADVGKTGLEPRYVNAAFEKWVLLDTVQLFGNETARGEIFPIRLNLRALSTAPVPETWKFTTQLVGAENRVIAQSDNFYPARLSEDGVAFADVQGIPIPHNAEPGEYQLILATYDEESKERLSLYDVNGNETSDFVPLGPVRVH
jgi:hypothetical protein